MGEEGDILFLNTLMWFHSTVIPPSSSLSVSYARDFFLPPQLPSTSTTSTTTTTTASPSGCAEADMVNVQGLVATTRHAPDAVILTESPSSVRHAAGYGHTHGQ